MIENIKEKQIDIFLDAFCDNFNIKLFPYQRWFLKERVIKTEARIFLF